MMVKYLLIILGFYGLSAINPFLTNVYALNELEARRQGIYFYDGDVTTICTASHGTVVMSNNIPEPHRSIISDAASQYSVNPNLLGALFLSEQGNVWKSIDGPFASSPVGASGPFQFMPGTWDSYKVDGNNDGIIDIQNFTDATFAAAKLAATGTDTQTPLGDINNPFAPGTLIYFAAAYNWGGGNLQRKTTTTSPITDAPKETQNYISNVYSLILSDFTKSGHPGYGDPRQPGGVQASSGNVISQSCSVSSGPVTANAEEARNIILGSSNIGWGHWRPDRIPDEKQDVRDCLTTRTLIAFATIATQAGVNIPINAITRDHGDTCNPAAGNHHARGAALDIGYAGSADPLNRHVADGDTLYKYLYNNRVMLGINELIWKYPPEGYNCMNDGVVVECSIYGSATLDVHASHIHVSFVEF